MTTNFENILISPDVKIRDALKVIDKQAMHAALVVLECNKLIGLVTDIITTRSDHASMFTITLTLPFLAYASLVSPPCFVLSKDGFSDWIL